MSRLFDKLKEYQKTDAYPFHMPGHKRNMELMRRIYGEDFGNPFGIDITEIDGFDDLHHAEEILKECMDEMAEAVGAKKSYFVVNGSTCGLLSAIWAACPAGSSVAVARNCHRSVAHAIQLNQLRPYYIYPQNEPQLWISLGITCVEVEDILSKHVYIHTVVVTSPTYEGIVADISGIAEVVHRHGAVLIVDEAHGAHLPFGRIAGLPQSAVSCGADLVIQSLHKTLPSMTQSAALHVCSDRVDIRRIEQGLRIFETSSPSYVMMAGMDACMRFMKAEGENCLLQLNQWLSEFYKKAKSWAELWVLNEERIEAQGFLFDHTKLVFGAKHIQGCGKMLHQWLVEDYHLQPEMSTPEYVVLMSTVGDTEEGFRRLLAAMEDINRRLTGIQLKNDLKSAVNEASGMFVMPEAKVHITPFEAAQRPHERVNVRDALERIAAEMAYIYPPGIPFLMPGEIIGKEQIELMQYYTEAGRELHGMDDETGQTVWVVAGED